MVSENHPIRFHTCPQVTECSNVYVNRRQMKYISIDNFLFSFSLMKMKYEWIQSKFQSEFGFAILLFIYFGTDYSRM